MKNTNEYMRKYMAEYRAKLRAAGVKKSNVTEFKGYYHKLRKEVYAILGSKCNECGCDVDKILEINHVKGNGRKDTLFNKNKKSFFRKFLRSEIDRSKYNLLCRVCNANHYVRDVLKVKGIVVSYSPVA